MFPDLAPGAGAAGALIPACGVTSVGREDTSVGTVRTPSMDTRGLPVPGTEVAPGGGHGLGAGAGPGAGGTTKSARAVTHRLTRHYHCQQRGKFARFLS